MMNDGYNRSTASNYFDRPNQTPPQYMSGHRVNYGQTYRQQVSMGASVPEYGAYPTSKKIAMEYYLRNTVQNRTYHPYTAKVEWTACQQNPGFTSKARHYHQPVVNGDLSSVSKTMTNECAVTPMCSHKPSTKKHSKARSRSKARGKSSKNRFHLAKKIQEHLEYYFSDKNLRENEYFIEFLQRTMDEEGWVPIEFLLKFNRLRRLGATPGLVVEAAFHSSVVEVESRRRRGIRATNKNWQKGLGNNRKHEESRERVGQ